MISELLEVGSDTVSAESVAKQSVLLRLQVDPQTAAPLDDIVVWDAMDVNS
jgi:hypothetical protein